MAQERKPKRQRFSLGGPSGDTSFEDYLTGNHKTTSSDDEDFDQENQDPEEEFDQDEEDEVEDDYFESEGDFDDEAPPFDPTPAPDVQNTIDKIHISQNNITNSSAKNINLLIQIRLVLPGAKVPPTRLLCLPSTLLFEQFSEAIHAAFDWQGGHLWKFDLEKAKPTKPSSQDALPDPRNKITDIKDMTGLHNLGMNDFRKDLDSKKIRLTDIWGAHLVPEVRKLNVFYTYDCYGSPWYHRISFFGVAEEGLKAEDMGIKVKSKQQRIWCFGGSGAAWPEDLGDGESQERWEEETNLFEWDVGGVNEQLSEVKVV